MSSNDNEYANETTHEYNTKFTRTNGTSTFANKQRDNELTSLTPIQEFYQNQTVFITGGTGFLGKALIEKLSRCCLGISRIYVLVRKKKDKDPNERLQESIQDPLFDVVRARVPNFERKITAMAGDCSLENLGLCEDDAVVLKREVSIVFHCAATVRFDEKLKKAAAVNIQSTVTIVDLCKDMAKLKAFIYVSTAFAHIVNNRSIEEKFYDYWINHRDFLLVVNSLPEEIIEAITPPLLKPWLNSYTCTKAIAEEFLKTETCDLPIAVFRPVIVTPSAYEPVPGWGDNYNGATGVIAGYSSGVIRTVLCNTEKRANLVPVDLTANALVASAWDVATQETRRGKTMLIYNFTSGRESPITWDTVHKLTVKYHKMYPLNTCLWYPFVRLVKYEFVYKFYKLVLHLIPAFVIDLTARCLGRKPETMKLYDRVYKMSNSFSKVTANEWDVSNDNVKGLWNKLDSDDRNIFPFTMNGFDWENYFSNYIKGNKIFLFKENLENLDVARLKYKKLYLMDKALRVVFVASVYCILRKISKRRSYTPPY